MSDKDIPLESLFQDAFREELASPSGNLWSGIEETLDQQSVEQVYRKKFNDDEVKPAAGLWFKIQTQLFIRQFLTFQATKLNIYYVAGVALLAGIGFGLFSDEDYNTLPANTIAPTEKSHALAHDIQHEEDIDELNTREENNTSNLRSVISNNEEKRFEETASHTDKISNKNIDVVQNNKSEFKKIIEAEKSTPKNKVEIKNAEPAIPVNKVQIDGSKYAIIGRDQTCKGNECTYSLNGVGADEKVDWNIPTSAKLISEQKDLIRVLWQSDGETSIQANISIGTSTVTKKFFVFVDKPVELEFDGKKNVCQGSESIPYSVTNDRDLGKQYIWEVKNNPYTIISNGYMKVEWLIAGVDTITLTDINLVTQCKSERKIPVFVKKQPTGIIQTEMVGLGQYQFEFSEPQKGFKYKWDIEGKIYTDEAPIHSFEREGDQFVYLEITDRSKCKSTYKVNVGTRIHNLEIPNAFSPEYESKGYIPVVSSELIEYRMEIFNASNERIWETTKLEDGKPVEGWDGTYRGKKVPSGKYGCRISATFEDGTVWQGFYNSNNKTEFTLIR